MQNPYWKVVGGNVVGHIYDRQRCIGKFKSVIPHINYSKIFGDGLFIILVHSHVRKRRKTVTSLIGRWWGEMLGDTFMIGKGVVRSE